MDVMNIADRTWPLLRRMMGVHTAVYRATGGRVGHRLPGLPQVDLVPAVERYFDLVQRTVDINRRLAIRWAEATGTLSGAIGCWGP